MCEYTITFENENGIDIVTFSDPIAAVNFINSPINHGYKVTYTGDPFTDAAALAEQED